MGVINIISGTTYTVPSATCMSVIKSAKVWVIGAGGGGADASIYNSGGLRVNEIGSGGGAGGVVYSLFSLVNGSTFTYTIGAAGAGGYTNYSVSQRILAVAGGSTTFAFSGTTLTANGGTPGIDYNTAGTGGGGSGGSVSIGGNGSVQGTGSNINGAGGAINGANGSGADGAQSNDFQGLFAAEASALFAVVPAPTFSAPVAPTCTSRATFTVTNYQSGTTYTSSPAGITFSGATGTGAGGTYTVTASTAGGCNSTTSKSITLATQPPTPAIPTISGTTAATCTTNGNGSFTISNYVLANNYTYTSSPAGVTFSGATATAPGGASYTIMATNSIGCTSAASSSVVIAAQPASPAVPALAVATQPTCSVPTGTITISNYLSANTYNFTPATGTSRLNGTITAPSGTLTVSVTNSNGCTTATAVTLTAVAGAPLVPILADGPIVCGGTAGTFMIANYNAAYTYTYSPSTGVTRSGNIISAPLGTYTVTANNGSCLSSPSAPQTIVSVAKPGQPILYENNPGTCSAIGSLLISSYNSNYTYTLSPAVDVNSAAYFRNVPPGTYTITASANGCTSVASGPATTLAPSGAAAKPTLAAGTLPTCSTTTGTFTISNYNSAFSYTVYPSAGVTRTGATISAPPGTYVVNATNTTCGSASLLSAAFTLAAPTGSAALPVLVNGAQPDCNSATGMFIISNYNASLTYVATPGTGVTQSGNTFTAPAGSYTVVANNGANCPSVASNAVIITVQPSVNNIPVLALGTAATCAVPYGTFTITNYDGTDLFTITPSAGVTRTNNIITAPVGTYTVTAISKSGGCTSPSSATITIAAPTGCVINVSVKVLLQGAMYKTGNTTMRTDLNSQHLLPTSQPYNTASAATTAYSGTEMVASSFFAAHTSIVDWVLVELRSGTNARTVLSRRAAFLNNDGTIVDLDGTSPVSLQGPATGNYYISVSHRNQLVSVSAVTPLLSSTSVSYDYTSQLSQSLDNGTGNAVTNVGVTASKWSLWAGDYNHDNVIDVLDLSKLVTDINAAYIGVYMIGDLNFDGYVDVLDLSLMKNSISAAASSPLF